MAAKYTDVITTKSGTVLPGAIVQLLTAGGALVTTYTDDALTQNPATQRVADDNGLVQLYVADGTYTVRSSYGGISVDLANVELFDLSHLASQATYRTSVVSGAPVTLITQGRYSLRTSTGAITLNLPALSSVSTGDWIDLLDIDYAANTNNVTINAAGADQIALFTAAAGTQTLNLAGVHAMLVANATNWRLAV